MKKTLPLFAALILLAFGSNAAQAQGYVYGGTYYNSYYQPMPSVGYGYGYPSYGYYAPYAYYNPAQMQMLANLQYQLQYNQYQAAIQQQQLYQLRLNQAYQRQLFVPYYRRR